MRVLEFLAKFNAMHQHVQNAMRMRRELSRVVNEKLKPFDALITASALTSAEAFSDIDPNTSRI